MVFKLLPGMKYCLKLAFLTPMIFGLLHNAGAQTFDWAVQMGSTGNDNLNGGVAGDAAGNVYVVGSFLDDVDFDPGAGSTTLSSVGNEDAFLAKYDVNGQLVWAKKLIGGPATDKGVDVVVTPSGKVNVIGTFSLKAYFNTGTHLDSLADPDLYAGTFIAQYDAAGNFQWTKGIYKAGAGNGIAIDEAENIYVTGFFWNSMADFNPGTGKDTLANVSSGSGNQSNIYIAKYDPNGNYIWAKGIGGTDHAQSFDIAVDKNNNLYITGFTVGTMDFDPGTGVANLVSTDDDVFIAKYDSAGSYIWAKVMGGAATDMGNNIAVNNEGYVYIAGNIMSPEADFDPGPDTVMLRPLGAADVFFAKYNSAGDYIWAKSVGAVGGITLGAGLVVDTLGSAYIGGTFMGADIDLDPGPDTAIVYPGPGGLLDLFLAKYDACGNHIWSGGMPGSNGSINGNSEVGVKLGINPQQKIFVTGTFQQDTDMDPTAGAGLLTAIGSSDIFVSKLAFADTPSIVSYLTVEECNSFTLNGTVYTNSGQYKQIIPGVNRCDSTYILDLTIHKIVKPVITVDEFKLEVATTYTSYQWFRNDTLINGATTSTYNVTANASYYVVVTDGFGCTDTSDVYTVTNLAVRGLNAEQIHIFPNPAKEYIYIQSPVAVNAILMNIEGSVVAHIKDARSISLKGMTAGMYLLRITDENGMAVKTEKLVKTQ